MASSSKMKNSLENFLIPLEEINSATNHFDEKNLIGDGGFGKVYEGKLSQRWGNRKAAIKRRDLDSRQGKNEFETEIQMVSTIWHRNIVSFIGYCDEDEEMIIVYEYAIEGSLDNHLSDAKRRGRLTWAQRLNICLGAARGLEYLHSGLGDDRKIIHRDVKSANILLDEYLQAKISDFGLSKSGLRNQQHSDMRTRVAGTKYYLDPLYDDSSILTKKSDVYSFGVVLFEMLSGMLVFHKRRIGEEMPLTLINLVRQNWNVGLDNIIDRDIRDEIDGHSLETFKSVAYKCISFNMKERPMMDSIVKEIEKALKHQNSWKKLLPRNYQQIIKLLDPHVAYKNIGELDSLLFAGILVDGGMKWFCMNEMNNKGCLMISAMELFYNDPNVIGWESFPGTRFTHVAKFRCGRSSWGDHVHKKAMHVTATMLSLESTYAVFLICKYTSKEHKADTNSSPPDIGFELCYGEKKIWPSSAEWKDEEWMEVELFKFTNHMEVAKFKIRLNWRYFGDYELCVEGIEFRPIEMATIENAETKVEQLSELEPNTDWESKLPSDYEEVISRLPKVPELPTKQEVYSLLSRGILIDDNSMWFWLDALNGKKCVLLSGKCLTVNHIDGESAKTGAYLQSRESVPYDGFKFVMYQSRFPTLLTVQYFSSAEIGCKIKAHMLSPKTPYAAWLVYGVLSFEGLCIASLTLGNQEKKTRRVYLEESSEIVRPMNDPEYKKDKHIGTGLVKLDRRRRKRVAVWYNNWYEVELFPFFNDMDAHDEVEVGVHINSKCGDDYIYFDGIEFRPQ